jgi:hypothetical protein
MPMERALWVLKDTGAVPRLYGRYEYVDGGIRKKALVTERIGESLTDALRPSYYVSYGQRMPTFILFFLSLLLLLINILIAESIARKRLVYEIVQAMDVIHKHRIMLRDFSGNDCNGRIFLFNSY